MALRQLTKRRHTRVQGRNDQLGWQGGDLGKKAPEVRLIELGSQIIHKQGCELGPKAGVAMKLAEQQRRCDQFLLSAGHAITRDGSLETDHEIGPMRTTVCEPPRAVAAPGCCNRLL